jgi:hypothetical protein
MDMTSLPRFPAPNHPFQTAPQRNMPGKGHRGLLLLLGLAVTVTVASTFTLWTVAGRAAALEAIKECRGKDLSELEPDQIRPLLTHLSKLGVKCAYPSHVDQYGPWYVWDFKKKGQPPLYLLFEAGKQMRANVGNQIVRIHPHPGSTPISLTLLDDSGKVVSETDLTTGWRCYLRQARLEPALEEDYPLVVLETELGSGPGPDIGRQYYAWVGQRFDLVRLEDSGGAATRNRYYIKHWRCGHEIAKLTEAEWEADLTSADRVRVLRALVWLGGLHWDLRGNTADGRSNEDPDQVLLWRDVLARQKVIARILELLNSEDLWLRQAAQLAADPLDDHF